MRRLFSYPWCEEENAKNMRQFIGTHKGGSFKFGMQSTVASYNIL